jgi:sterol desaturase/sphingolipid hydroxylase (fatty acid hydroxylase superfamily)
MQTVLSCLKTYAYVLAVFLGAYFILSGVAWWLLYHRQNENWKSRKIQQRIAPQKAVIREIKHSVISIAILALMIQCTLYFIHQNKTAVYTHINDYGWFYLILSIILCLFLNDAYFYWMHRFMHMKKIFPIVHRIHHLSKTPTPWAIFSFSPYEMVLNYASYPVLIFFIPLHPAAITFLVIYSFITNLAGHFGFEFSAPGQNSHWLLKYMLTITHHDMHHNKVNCNYSLYFNIWDRIMKTNHPDYDKTFIKVQENIKNNAHEHRIEPRPLRQAEIR